MGSKFQNEKSVYFKSPDNNKMCNLKFLFCFRREQFVQWADNLADAQTPAWLGLPNNAEKLLLTNQAAYVIRSVEDNS